MNQTEPSLRNSLIAWLSDINKKKHCKLFVCLSRHTDVLFFTLKLSNHDLVQLLPNAVIPNPLEASETVASTTPSSEADTRWPAHSTSSLCVCDGTRKAKRNAKN
jgi:hypothetical protein